MRNLRWTDCKLNYFIWKAAAAKGFDAAWSIIYIEGDALEISNPAFVDTTWWPIRDNTTSPTTGGMANQPYRFANLSPSKGISLKMEWNAVGTANRAYASWIVEFRFFGAEYIMPEDKFNQED